ncbi:MAG: ABC transporter ATP-binding protein/permease [Clostridiales Family XIII bacterium]|nr:ABC transporter ATP-binding protein/permease [Clostridiales Family XIII bacterium]
MAMMPGEKAKNFGATMRTLLRYLKPYRARLFLVFAFAILGTAFSIVAPAIMGDATDIIVRGVLRGRIDFGSLRDILLLLAGLYLLSFLFSYVQGFIMSGVSQGVTYRLRRDMSEKMDRLPLRYYDSKTHGEMQSRMTNDIETVNVTLGQSLTQAVTSAVTIAGILVMMLRISLLMTAVALIVLPLSMALIRVIVRASQGHFADQQRLLGEINGHIEEMYAGHQTVRAFNGEADSIERFDAINKKLCDSAWKAQFLSGLMMPAMGFIGNLSYVFVCVTGGWLAVRGSVSIGSIQAFMQYVRSFSQPITMIANIVNVLQSTAAAAERVFEFLSEEEESPDPETEAVTNGFRGGIAFENVRFSYTDAPLIKDFSVHVSPGMRVAIVGPTGAGKTTLVKLLMRFYELDSGRVLIDGADISGYSRSSLRGLFGMVLQDAWLYSASVMENIRFGRPDASDDEVFAAARAAQVDHFIHTLPGGYGMVINEDATNISQGQKQLLTIARAFLADPPILILDEATSSVDTRTEALVQKAMRNLLRGRTAFIIAHRLSTIRDADLILLMMDGDIAEQGTHESLMQLGGRYAELYDSQFGG